MGHIPFIYESSAKGENHVAHMIEMNNSRREQQGIIQCIIVLYECEANPPAPYIGGMAGLMESESIALNDGTSQIHAVMK